MMNIEIYTREDCVWCVRAQELLSRHHIPFTKINMPEDISRDDIIEKFPTARTFPIIVINDKYIGGFVELEQYFNDGYLES